MVMPVYKAMISVLKPFTIGLHLQKISIIRRKMAAACCNCVPVVFTSQAEKAYHHSGKVTNADIKENIRIIEIHR